MHSLKEPFISVSFGIHISSSHLSGVFGCSWYVSHKSPMYLLKEPVPMYLLKEPYISVKRALYVSQKSPTYLSKEPYLCQKSRLSLAHLVSMYQAALSEPYEFSKRCLYVYQKSPVCLLKQPYISVKRALFVSQEPFIFSSCGIKQPSLAPVRLLLVHFSKEPCISIKRAMYDHQKSPILSNEPSMCIKRTSFLSRELFISSLFGLHMKSSPPSCLFCSR